MPADRASQLVPAARGRRCFVFVGLLPVLVGCRAPLPDDVEARAIDGRLLVRPGLPAAVRADREAKLALARERLATDPADRDAWIWVGRRLGYLGRYREAIAVYGDALRRWPGDPFLLRHRGHRWITVRRFDRAVADLERARRACRTTEDEVEPDGLPVPGRPPHSSLHFNVHYHLGLAEFLRGNWRRAERAWLDALACSDDDESRVAATHWLWCARMRGGDPAGARAAVQAIRRDMDVVENTSYHRLCLLYKGEETRARLAQRPSAADSSSAALRFGLAHHALVTGEHRRAAAMLDELLDDARRGRVGWAAFGVIAAEAERHRLE